MDSVWCEFTSPDAVNEFELFADAMHKEWPDLPLAYNYSSSFKWSASKSRLTFKQLGESGYKFIFITMGAPHASMYAVWNFIEDLRDNEEQAQFRLEKMVENHPTESHHKIGDFERFQKLEEEFLPAEFVRNRYIKSEGYGRN